MPKVAIAITPAAPKAPGRARAADCRPPWCARRTCRPWSKDASGGDDQRHDGRSPRSAARTHVEAERQDHRADDRADEGLEEVGAHAGDVADVVTDVVGDDGGVAGVVLGNARLDLADEVGADVGGLGVDAAADTREQRDRGGAHREAGDDVDRAGQLPAENVREDEVKRAETDRREADDRHAHDGAAGERHVQRRGQADSGRRRRSHVGVGRDLHADPAGRCRKGRTDDEGTCNLPTPGRVAVVGESENRGDRDHEHRQDAVLSSEEGERAFLNLGGDLDHVRIAGILFGNPTRLHPGEEKGEHARGGHCVDQILHLHMS